MKMRNLFAGLILGAALFLGSAVQAAEAPPAPEKAYAAKGEQTCLKCHDEAPATNILDTVHAVKGDERTPFAEHGCEGCHGASPEHIASAAKVHGDEKPLPPTVVFKGPNKSPASERNKACMSCHENGLRTNWAGSQHESSTMACTDCHTAHIKKDPVLVKATQPEKCFSCHAQQRQQSFQVSHHPIREGKVVCSDCHNPHGSAGDKMLKELTINDTCYTCHAEKRGPFLWEHQPVREDCTNCHTPHGSNETRLLKQHLPFLCTNCHDEGGHQGTSFNGNSLPGGPVGIGPATGTNNTGVVVSALSARMLARGCANCHSQVHGSNSPSGAYFNR
jgi:DmsE family decaheme c-type cytochrome